MVRYRYMVRISFLCRLYSLKISDNKAKLSPAGAGSWAELGNSGHLHLCQQPRQRTHSAQTKRSIPKNHPKGARGGASDFFVLPQFSFLLVRSPCKILEP